MIKSNAISQNVNNELTDVLYKNLPVSLFSVLFISSLILWQLWDQKHIFEWYSLSIGIIVYRFILFFWWYQTKKSSSNLLKSKFYLFYIGSSLTAITWGIIGSILMPNNLGDQAFILIIISGTLAGSTQSLNASYYMSMTYNFLTLLPVLTWEYLEILRGNSIYVFIFVLMGYFLIFSTMIAYRSFSILKSHIKLKLENSITLENLAKTHVELDKTNKLMSQYTKQIELYARMSETFQRCLNENELKTAFSYYITNIFPDSSGSLFFADNSNNWLQEVLAWGSEIKKIKELRFEDCLALRTMKIHPSNEAEPCKHVSKNEGHYVCAPLIANLTVLGLIHLQTTHQQPLSESDLNLLERISNDTAVSLNNFQLQLSLKSQAIHDFLTGLFNRLYLNEFLNHEVIRAQRGKTEIAVIMMDIDHFKNFNDTYGHELGDQILIKLASLFKENVRGSDIACRYGGEEFIIVLAGSSLETALERAKLIQAETRKLSVNANDKMITGITLSFGIALFPKHGTTVDQLINAADKALYQAKSEGRDRICIAKMPSII